MNYNGNSPSSGSAPTDGTAYSSGATVTVAGNSGSLVKSGFSFGGWCTTQPATGAACGGTLRAAASTFTILGSTTLYAQWTANTLTVTTDEQGGSGIANASTSTGASMASSPGTPTRSGYTFNGWFVASSGGSAITFPYAHGQTANFTLYAQWTLTCASGGECAVGDIGPGGGVVFYVHASGTFTSSGSVCNTTCRYLEVAPESSEVQRSWATGANTNRTVGTAGQPSIGYGYQNTIDIKNQSGNVAASSAATYAFEYVNNGKSDWHLPSRHELNQLCRYARNLSTNNSNDCTNGSGSLRANFSSDDYWSSTEVIDQESSKAWTRDFGSGAGSFSTNQNKLKSVTGVRVRPVRAF